MERKKDRQELQLHDHGVMQGLTTERKTMDLLPSVPDDTSDKTQSATASPIAASAHSISLASSAASVSQYSIIVNPVQVSQHPQTFGSSAVDLLFRNKTL